MVTVFTPRAREGVSLLNAGGDVVLTFDATISVAVTDAVVKTSHPVEDGADITDHARRELVKVSMSSVFTASPFGGQPERRRDQRLYQELLALLEARQPVTIVSSLRVLSNMLLLSVQAEASSSIGQSVRPQLEFEEVRFADQVTVTIPEGILAGRAKNAGASKTDAGKQEAKEAEEGTPEKQAADQKESSLANDLFGGSL